MPYFVTTRTYKSLQLFVGETANLAVHELHESRARYGFLLLAYVFMPDHAHFVIVPAPGFTIAQTMRVVKGRISRVVNRAAQRKGAVWQDGFRDNVAFTMDELNAYISYVHDNPIKAQIVANAEAYAFSSAAGAWSEDYERFLDEERLVNDDARAGKPVPHTTEESPATKRERERTMSRA